MKNTDILIIILVTVILSCISTFYITKGHYKRDVQTDTVTVLKYDTIKVDNLIVKYMPAKHIQDTVWLSAEPLECDIAFIDTVISGDTLNAKYYDLPCDFFDISLRKKPIIQTSEIRYVPVPYKEEIGFFEKAKYIGGGILIGFSVTEFIHLIKK